MKKPVVILADTDERYLSPLEMKFLTELEDTIELELITEEEFYNVYFSKPQDIDILVVSEELYSSEIQRQNIDNIFVLTEQPDNGGTEDLAITRIYKYTSIKEIYNQIIATSSGIIKTQAEQTKETEVVLVYSASGGVGKTTLAVGLSECLAENYKRVLYINAERTNNFTWFLNNRTDIASTAYAELSEDTPDIFNRLRYAIRNEKFDYMPPFSGAISTHNINYKIYEKIVESAKQSKEYDVIVVDTDSVFDDDKAMLITKADKVLMVFEQSKQSVWIMNRLMRSINCNDADKYCFLCNKFDENKPNALLDNEEKPKFITNEYIKKIKDIENMNLQELSKTAEIQKVAFILI